MSFFTWNSPPEKLGYLLGLVLFSYFGVVFVIDLEHRLILHPTSVFGAILGIITGFLKRGIVSTLLGALAGLLIMLLFYYLGVLFSRYRAQRMKAAGHEVDDEEALGAGDVILVTVLGFIVGWPLIWFCLLFGILLGGAVSLFFLAGLIITRKYSSNSMMIFLPYGPYLITSAIVIVFFPDLIRTIISG